MATPDVRIRLSAEGVAEITAAFRKVQTEAQAAAKKGGQGFGVFNTVLGSTGKLLAGLGLAATAASMVAFARGAADAADALGESAQAAGTTAERFSALGTVARLNGGDADLMRESLGRLAVRIEDLRQGAANAIEPFRKLGLTARSFAGKDTAEQFDVLATAMAKLPDSSEKTALAIDLLGRRGARLIPIMNELARVGLGGAIEKARELGVLLDDEVVDAAGRVSDELTLLNQSAQALATQFVAGLSPAVHQTFELMSKELADSQGIFREFGDVTGNVLKFLIALILELGDVAVLTVAVIASAIGGVVGTLIAAVTGKLDRIPVIWRNTLTSIQRLTDDFDARLKRRAQAVTAPVPAAAPRPTPGGTGTTSGGEDAAAFGKRLQATRSFLDSQLKAIQLSLKLEKEAQDRRLAEGLISLKQYYEARRRITDAGVAAEIAALEKRKATEAQNPDKAAGAVAVREITEEISRLRVQQKGDIAALAAEELEAQRKLATERTKFENEQLEQQGRTHEVRLAQIDEEVNAFQKVLAQQGLPDQDVFQRINAFRQLLVSGAEFDRQVADFTNALEDLQQQKIVVAQDVAAAAISEEEGQRRILALERERIPELERIAELAVQAAEASGDPARINAANALLIQIRELGVAAAKSDADLKNLHQTIGNALLPVLTDFLSGGKDGFENFGQAALEVIGSVIDALRRLTAEILATKILEKLGFSFAAAGHSGGGPVRRAAGGPLDVSSGGLMRGPGTSTSDSIWAVARGQQFMGSDTEYVVKAAAVRQPGMLSILEGINAEKITARDILPRQVPRGFAEGGPLSGAGGGLSPVSSTASISGRIGVALGPGLVAKEIKSSDGQGAVLEVLQGNREAALRALGLK